MKLKIFLTIFLKYQDYHFFKDPGQIPYRAGKLFGYQSKLMCFGDDKNFSETLRHFDLILLSQNWSRFKRLFTLLRYFVNNSKKIEIVHLMHFSWFGLFCSFIYKKLNKNGFVYLKLDNCAYTGRYEWEDILEYKKGGIKSLIIRHLFIKQVDLFSIEDAFSFQKYNCYPQLQNKLVISYNGHTTDLFYKLQNSTFEKKNIILTAGRLGLEQKATENLLYAFANLIENNKINDWVLYLAGGFHNDFQMKLDSFKKIYPYIFQNYIIIKGNLEKDALFKLYAESKIFALPSRWEGFANVFAEAMYFKNAIVTTKYVAPQDIIANKMGIIVEKDDIEGLSQAILTLIENPALLEKYGNNGFIFANTELNWDNIVQELFVQIQLRKKSMK